GRRGVKPEPIGVGYRLPDAPVQQLSALVEKLTEEPYNGRADLPHLADEENLTTDELLPLLELLQLLGLATVSGGDIELTGAGRRPRAEPGKFLTPAVRALQNVIPGRGKAVSPESIFQRPVFLDSGPGLPGRPGMTSVTSHRR